ncbi:DUF4262 domain-containing protein [Actinocrispum sp. NPDC049592]|uniref:DUF4262 domain-containing protein n=1 Tax=Actinocrispum sp. NPDC049592 TaxID=3154835 RepID=UPI003426D190
MTSVTAAPLNPDEQRYRDWILREVETTGAVVIDVPPDEEGAGYTFSVGAWRRFGVAEAVVLGLPEGMGNILINLYLDRAKAGERFLPGHIYENFFEGVPITVERVAKGHYMEYFGSAFVLYRKGDFPALQLIVPTPQGHWPWSPDAPPGFQDWQHVLTESGLPESWLPGHNGP